MDDRITDPDAPVRPVTENKVISLRPVNPVEGVDYDYESVMRKQREAWVRSQVFLDPKYSVIHDPLDPRLYAPNKKIKDVKDLTVIELAKTLAGLHIIEGGVGLAAPQIGLNLRMFAMSIQNNRVAVLMNPRIVGWGKYREDDPEAVEWMEERCLSHPGVSIEVARLKAVEIIAQTITSPKPTKYLFEGFPARVVQHEIAHLEGKLITDLPETVSRNRKVDAEGQLKLQEENRKASEFGRPEPEG
ncbi:MAG: peptide deformylase [Minisyncoccia bacterium]